MTRHARNSTAGSVYTYHEKQRDAKASGYGSNSLRLSKDSVKEFDCCSLTLQPCRSPVVSPDGYLYDKEAILEYIIAKKNEYSRKLKDYQKQKEREEQKKAEHEAAEFQGKVEKFVSTEKGIVTENASASSASGSSTTLSNMMGDRSKQLPSFWVPSQTPDAKPIILKKPDPTIYCPVSEKPLKAKDLIPVKFTLAPDDDSGPSKKSLISKKVRYMCPVTRDILSNSVPCAVLKPTGDVVTMDCVEKIIKKDMTHPLTGQSLKDSDIIVLQRGGTGFASANEKLKATEHRPVMHA
nr:EOG090X08E0 [Eulimnadia texana]